MAEWRSWGSSADTDFAVDNLEPGTEWAIQVRAVSENGVVGEWSNEIALVVEYDSTAPAAPSAPILTTKAGTVTVTWNGLAGNGDAMARDLARLRIYQQGTVAPVGSINSKNDFAVITGLSVHDEYLFRFTAVDHTGNESTPSGWSAITVASVLDDPDIAQGIEDIAIEAASGATGGNLNNYSLNDPPTSGNENRRAEDVWYKINSGGQVIGVWSWSGSAWVPRGITNAAIDNLDAGKITTGTLAAARIAANSITADKINAGAVTSVKLSADAIDGKTITGATVRTAPTGTRVQLDSTGLKAFSGSTQMVHVSTGDGKLYATGAELTSADITGSLRVTGTILTGTRTSPTSGGTGTVLDSNGYIHSSSASTPFFIVNPNTQTMSIGTGDDAITYGSTGLSIRGNVTLSGPLVANGPGESGLRIEPNGRLRIFRSNGALAIDLNPAVNSYNVNVDGGINSDLMRASQGVYSNLISNLSGDQLSIDAGRTYIPSAHQSPVNYSIAWEDQSVAVSSSGQLVRLVYPGASAARLKVAIEPIEFPDAVLELEPVSWYWKNDTEAYADLLHRQTKGEEVHEDEFEFLSLYQEFGFVAEDVDAAGLGRFVGHTPDGEAKSIRYDRLWMALIPTVRGLRDRVAQLEQQLGESA